MQHTLVAVFDNRSDAQNALDELLASGFERNAVSLSSADPTGQTDSLTGATTTTDEVHEEGIGASIKHFFTGLFGSDNDEHAQKYANVVSRGHYAVTLTTDSEPEVERAADVIERFGPVDIDERHDQLAAGGNFSAGAGAAAGTYQSQAGSMQSAQPGDRNYYANQDLNDPVPQGQTYQEPLGQSLQSGTQQQSGSLQGTRSLTGSDDASLGGTVQQSAGSLQRDAGLTGSQQYTSDNLSGTQAREGRTAIPVVQEDVKIGKREVNRGGVRVFSRVVETPVNESVNLREEHVSVERRPVDQPISTADKNAFKEQSIELREKAEEAVVQKTARVVEEVVVGKEVSQRQQQIKDTVRRTDVQVEQLNSDAYRSHFDTNYAGSGSNYDDLQPAYLYGSEARRAEKYRNRDWNDVESDLKSDWSTRNNGGDTGASAWDRIKAAVRHGWDKVTPDSYGSDLDDDYYRNHWSTNYASAGGSYDDYVPAYRYGNEARTRYSGRNWDDVESDLRSDWDTRYANSGASTWEKFKGAVRSGWDRVTS